MKNYCVFALQKIMALKLLNLCVIYSHKNINQYYFNDTCMLCTTPNALCCFVYVYFAMLTHIGLISVIINPNI